MRNGANLSRHTILVAFPFVFGVIFCRGGYSAVPTINIQRFEEKIVIDGRLDEPVWQKITPVTSFTQTEPDEGKPISERTEVRIFYDRNNIYFGFRCFDHEPQKIIKRLDIHDASTSSDSVDILLDTFHDRKSGYFFSINSRGVQFDATVLEQNGRKGFEIYDPTWNAVWQDATTFDNQGWSAEIAIPFKILRFPRTSGQEWGINLNRWVTRKNENSRWVLVTRFDQVMKPSKAGLLTGLRDVQPGHALDFIPFATGTYNNFGRSDFGMGNNEGIDVKYGLTSNLALDATANPDFSQTEADQIDLSLSRFELFFPEKRNFFNEGLDNFQTPLNLFFTRRIGAALPDGEPQKLLVGAKITGKIGAYKIGFLEARMQQRSFASAAAEAFAPSANFFVLRLSRDILEKSSIGFITVNRDQDPSDFSFSEHVHGLDANLLLGDHISWSSQLSFSSSPRIDGALWKRTGAISSFSYNSELWEYNMSLRALGDEFDVSQIGFEPETGRYGGFANLTYKPYINCYGIRQLFIGPNYDHLSLQDGRIDDSGADFSVTAQFKNFWQAEIGYSYDRVRFNRFTPDLKPLPDGSTRVYVNPKIFASVTSNNNRPVWFNVQLVDRFHFVNFPFFFHGRTRNWNGSLNFKLGEKFRTNFIVNVFQERFADGKKFQNRGSAIWRLSGNFTRKWQARLLLQYSSQIDPTRFIFDPLITDFSAAFGQKRVAVNSLVAYDFNARSALFVGYNNDTFSPQDRQRRGREFFMKFSYLFAY